MPVRQEVGPQRRRYDAFNGAGVLIVEEAKASASVFSGQRRRRSPALALGFPSPRRLRDVMISALTLKIEKVVAWSPG